MNDDPVPPSIEKEAELTAWNVLVAAARDWAENYMDQWDQFQLDTEFGPVYVSLTRQTEYPESFAVEPLRKPSGPVTYSVEKGADVWPFGEKKS